MANHEEDQTTVTEATVTEAPPPARKRTPPERKSVRELGADLDPAVYAGVVAARGWQEHDLVTPAAFRRAVNVWLHGDSRAAG